MTLEHLCSIYIPVAFVILLWAFMQWNGKLPTTESIQALATITATKGGNIIILVIMAMAFFFAGMRLIYYCLSLSIDGKLSTDNAVMMLAITFVTGTAFGATLGALLKTMTGENVKGDTSSLTVSRENTPPGPAADLVIPEALIPAAQNAVAAPVPAKVFIPVSPKGTVGS